MVVKTLVRRPQNAAAITPENIPQCRIRVRADTAISTVRGIPSSRSDVLTLSLKLSSSNPKKMMKPDERIIGVP